MYSILSNSQICYRRSCCPVILPEFITIRIYSKITLLALTRRICQGHWPGGTLRKQRKSLKRTFGEGLPQCQNRCNKQAKSQHTCYWVSTSLMCKNFSGWNIQKHNHKQKQNGQSSNVNQQLQKHKIFKPQKNLQPRTMQKQQYLIKYRVNRVFRAHHLKYTHQCTSRDQSKRLTHCK